MKKIAIFVEGQTEQIFVKKLIEEISTHCYIQLWECEGSRDNRKFKLLNGKNNRSDEDFFVLIYNSSGDESVLSDIRLNIEKLHEKGFEKVLGLKDVYPHVSQKAKERVIKGRNFGIPKKYMACEMILAIMEIETWFLAESRHFEKLHQKLTINHIKDSLGIDLNTIDFQEIEHPSETLNQIYRLVGFGYNKKYGNVMRTVNALDFENIYLGISKKVSSLEMFISELDSFF